MNIFNIFKKKPGTGANLDTRSDKEKVRDYKFEEIVAAVNPVNWMEKPQSQWRTFPIFNQDGSGSCVAQTMAKLLGILYWIKNQIYVHFSATHIYQRRANRPNSGMAGVDAFNVAREGVTLEELVPSQGLTDAQMDGLQIPQYKKDVGEVFKIGNFVKLPSKDIETIASVIQTTGKAVMVWFYFKIDEWTNQPEIKDPILDMNAPTTARHSVSAVDYFLKNGKKCLLIEDSWGPGYALGGRRIITDDFFKERNWFAAYPMNFAFDNPAPEKPRYLFTKTIQFGDKDPDVKALQDILKYEGFFPQNADSTGYYGAITSKGVLQFQTKHKVDAQSVLELLAGRTVGPMTIRKLNEIYKP